MSVGFFVMLPPIWFLSRHGLAMVVVVAVMEIIGAMMIDGCSCLVVGCKNKVHPRRMMVNLLNC